MKPTPDEIHNEVEILKDQLVRVRRFNVFGEDNREKIQAQIDVLENDYDHEDIDFLVDEDFQDDALEALYWLSGDSQEQPSAGWEPLCS